MPYAATIGFFDGVHTGHRYVLEELRRTARERNMESAVITFREHPQNILTGERKPLLTTYDERMALLREQRPDQIFDFDFRVIRDMTAAEFLHVLGTQCGVKVLLMGYDHRFGSDGLTAFNDYRSPAQQEDIELIQLPQAPAANVSSTKIRKALLQGDISVADSMLGYHYTLTGEVIAGRHIGSGIGFPTANIRVPDDKLLPAHGVYAADVRTADGKNTMAAICNIGNNPTVGGGETTVEIHIPGFNGDLYGTTISASLTKRIREERQFPSIEELRRQIEDDVKQIEN